MVSEEMILLMEIIVQEKIKMSDIDVDDGYPDDNSILDNKFDFEISVLSDESW